MKRRIALRLKQAALKAARPARRGIVRALRHHAASARRQSARANPSVRSEPAGVLRAWLRALVAALLARNAVRSFSLNTLLRHNTRPRAAAARDSYRATSSRRVRRLAGSAGWFSFAP
jgi:hypothetical protein